MKAFFEKWVVVIAVLLVLGTGSALAHQGHNHGSGAASTSGNPGMMPHHMSMAMRPVQSVTVNGLKISVDVMGMGMHVHMQEMKGSPLPDTFDRTKSQAIMVMIEASGIKKIVKDADVTVTVVGPTGETKVGKAPWYGDHYGLSFSSDEDGTYQILVAVLSDGVKREAEFKHVE